MKKEVWGNAVWLLFHTLAEKIKEEYRNELPVVVSHITQICNNLPCPECSEHAKQFWSKVKTSNINNKTDLINLLFVFHNMVNKRKQIKAFKYENLKYYEHKNLIETYNTFSQNFNTKGNMSLINESFRRNMMLTSLKKWIMANIIHFDK